MTHETGNFEGMTLERLAGMTMNGFAHLNVKIEGIEKRLDAKIDNLERKMNNRFDIVIARLDDQETRKVSRVEFDKLDGRVEALETSPQTS